jgi:hypothetical protein
MVAVASSRTLRGKPACGAAAKVLSVALRVGAHARLGSQPRYCRLVVRNPTRCASGESR